MHKNPCPDLLVLGLLILGLVAAGCGDDDSPNVPVVPDLFLGQVTNLVEIELPDDGFTGVKLSLYVRPGYVSLPYGWFFENRPVQSSDVGDSTVFDAGNCVHFAVLADALSNGVDDWINFAYEFVGTIPYFAGRSSTESSAWVGGVTGDAGPDFEGYEVRRVVLHVDEVVYDVADPTLTNFTFSARVRVWGRELP